MKLKHDDAEREALLGHFRIEEPADLFCGDGREITWMCLNAECEHRAMICYDPSCSHCQKGKHKRCSWASLHTVTNMLAERTAKQRVFILGLYDIENNFLEQIQKSRR
jgi:hypothetical protein